jgi:hypothetical protein
VVEKIFLPVRALALIPAKDLGQIPAQRFDPFLQGGRLAAEGGKKVKVVGHDHEIPHPNSKIGSPKTESGEFLMNR